MATDIHGETYEQHLQRSLDCVCAEAATLRTEVTQLKRLLHDLTPMGSEFANNPTNCACWVATELSRRLAQAIECKAALSAKIGECDQLEGENERLSLAIIGMCRDYDAPLPSCIAAGSTGEF